MANKSRFPVIPALIGFGLFLLLRNKKTPPPRTIMDVRPSTQADATNEVKKAVRGQL